MIDHAEAFLANHPRLLLVGDRAFRIFIILAVIFISAKLIHLICVKFLKFARDAKAHDPKRHHEREKRLATVVGLIDTSLRVVVYGIGLLMILRECGLDITPLLTGAGIAGVAIGLGSQSLVKDMLSGLFLLLEDQIRIGDFVRINNNLSGSVEKMELRVTAIRDGDGTLHIIPNGEIKSVSNTTYDFSVAAVDIPIPYKTNIDNLFRCLEKTVTVLNSVPEIKSKLRDRVEFLGITAFSDTSMTVSIIAKTEPHSRVFVAKEIRKQVLMELQLAEIQLSESRATQQY